MGTFLLGTGWRRLFVRGILFVGMSLLVRGRFFPRTGWSFRASLSVRGRSILGMGCVFRASLFFRVRGILSAWRILPLRRTRWTRQFGTRCWSATGLGFRPRRVVLRFVLGVWSGGVGA